MESIEWKWLIWALWREYLLYSTLVLYILMWPTIFSYTCFGIWITTYAHACFHFYRRIPGCVSILRCPLGRLGFLGALGYFRYDIFGVVSENLKYSRGSRCIIFLMRIYRRTLIGNNLNIHLVIDAMFQKKLFCLLQCVCCC